MRPALRTATMNQDMAAQIKLLFGTLPNAQRRLDIDPIEINAMEFRRALNGETVKPDQVDVIEDAWRAWLRQWIKGPGEGLGFSRNLTFVRLSDDEEKEFYKQYQAARR